MFLHTEVSGLLSFIGGDENTSLQGWRQETRETAGVIITTLQNYASHETNLDDLDATPLSYVYSLFSVLSVLVSEEFDAVLVAFCENDLMPLASLLPKGTGINAVSREAGWIAHRVRLAWDHADKNKGLKSVRELTPYEMKLRLQYRGLIPHTMPPSKRFCGIKSPVLKRAVWDNLFLAIDPFTPPELAGKKVEAMLRSFQEERAKETVESWSDEVKAGIVDDEFAARDAEQERLKFDFRRAFTGNKKTRGEGTTFEVWLRRLKVYDLARRGISSKEIGEKLFKNDTPEAAAVKISQDKAQARAMIDAALSGVPVSAVANIRARR
jgi:tRNA-binding EMAP/Myf-like protein